MKRPSFPVAAGLCLAASVLHSGAASAQSSPTASRTLQPSVFLGISGDYTGLEGGKNLSLTAGADLGLPQSFGFTPAIELRGTYPVDSGQIVGEESVEAGIRVSKRYTRFRPYADLLFGRGELNYQNGGFIVPAQSFRYLQSTTNVFSPGIGTEVDATDQLALLVDAQFQHWNIPFSTGNNPAAPGSITSKVITIGVVYRFGWLEHGHPAP